MTFNSTEMLPNDSKFKKLHNALKNYNSDAAGSAFIAADGYNMALKQAAQQRGDNFDKFFSKASAEHEKVATYVSHSDAAKKMNDWLDAAKTHTLRVSKLHMKRSSSEQLRYVKGRSASGIPTSEGPKVDSNIIDGNKNLLIIAVVIAAVLAVIVYTRSV